MKHFLLGALGLLGIFCTQQLTHAAEPFIQEYVQFKINLNSATFEELVALPGIGEQKARAILTRREQQPFHTISELRSIKGFGAKLVASLQDKVEAKPVE